MLQLIKEASLQHGVRVRILVDIDDIMSKMVVQQDLKQKEGEGEGEEALQKISVQHLSKPQQTKITILVVDKAYCMTIEMRDATATSSNVRYLLPSAKSFFILSIRAIARSILVLYECYEALKKKWQYDVSSETDWLEYEEKEGLKCEHSWQETSIYKLGKFHFCIKCHRFVSEKFMKYYNKRRRASK